MPLPPDDEGQDPDQRRIVGTPVDERCGVPHGLPPMPGQIALSRAVCPRGSKVEVVCNNTGYCGLGYPRGATVRMPRSRRPLNQTSCILPNRPEARIKELGMAPRGIRAPPRRPMSCSSSPWLAGEAMWWPGVLLSGKSLRWSSPVCAGGSSRYSWPARRLGAWCSPGPNCAATGAGQNSF